MKTAGETIGLLQDLGDTGYNRPPLFYTVYAGKPEVLDTYLAGDHRPDEIMQFGKSHRIIINRLFRR
jgi:hypothetical protein